MDWEGKREERRAYIESRVRKVVGMGGVGEMERRGKGERVGVEDVEGIEGVARGMGMEL